MTKPDPCEVPRPHQVKDWSYYVVYALFVLPVSSVTPLSWAFVSYWLIYGRAWHSHYFLLAASSLEVAFSLYHYFLVSKISSSSPTPLEPILQLLESYKHLLQAGLIAGPPLADEESLDDSRPCSPIVPISIIPRLNYDDPRAQDFRQSLRTWFSGAPWSEIRLRQVHQWLYAFIYNKRCPPPEKLSKEERDILSDTVALLEKRTGCRIPEGDNPSVKPMLLTLDDVNIAFRPLIFYALVAAVNLFLRMCYIKQWGVQFKKHDGIEYLVRIPESWSNDNGSRPIVFIHGLGLGLAQYHVTLIHLFQTFSDRPILVPLQPHISQDIFHPRFLMPPSRKEMADNLSDTLLKLGWVNEHDVSAQAHGVIMLSHSNGSYSHAWMLKTHPKMVTRSCFVDPVTFCSWEGDVCYNFLYRPCTTGIQLLMRYFVGQELGVANLLTRHFDWSANSLWAQEIPNVRDPSKTLFLLGGKDDILQAERVEKYLKSHGVRKGLWIDPNARHGEALVIGGKGHNELLRWLKEPEAALNVST